MDKQHKFLTDMLSELEDILFDAECDLGRQSVIYEKLKTLIGLVEEYQEGLV